MGAEEDRGVEVGGPCEEQPSAIRDCQPHWVLALEYSDLLRQHQHIGPLVIKDFCCT